MTTARAEWRAAGVRAAAAAVLGLAVGACASAGGRAPLPDPGPGACRPTPEAAARRGTLTVAAAGEVDPLDAPLPRSDAERVLFRHLYGTLVEVDCRGNVRPGLAEAWSSDRGGTRWTFRLDPEARFAGGSPVTADAVVTAWHETDLSAGAGQTSPLDDVAVTAASEETVVVTLETALRDPAVFARPRFAVAGPGGRSAWPLASGSHRPAPADGREPPGRTVALAPANPATGGSRLRLVAHGASGARDVLDGGADLLLTRDPGAADYAATLSTHRIHRLPWDRTWILVLPGAGTAADTAAVGPGWEAVRRELAGEAVPADARPAEDALPWAACPASSPDPSGGSATSAGSPSIVYPADEPTARALAARLAALAGGAGAGEELVARVLISGGPAGSSVRTEGLEAGAYARSLRRGSAAGFLLTLPVRPLAPCLLRREVLRRAPWLEEGGRLVALVETRPFLVLRRGAAGVRLDWDGTPRLEAAGWDRPIPGGWVREAPAASGARSRRPGSRP